MIADQQITPTLKLVRLLGQGAMGSVWVAEHAGLGTQVAVKFMSPALAQNEGVIQRFRREATAAAHIKSPHVAQVFDHGVTADGVPYIVMELLEGEDLGMRIRRAGPLDAASVAEIVRQVAKALTRAHSVGIVHRDIKPDNIFLQEIDGDLHVKVLDFGIAKQPTEAGLGMTSTGAMVGTPLYMSPEQLLSSKHVDFRSDLWSLGVVAYRALTGVPPFNGETLGALSVVVHAGTFSPPSVHRADISAAIDAWFARALKREPAERFGSAKEMADELERAVSGRASFMPMPSYPDIRARASDPPPAPGALGMGYPPAALSSQPSQPSQPQMAGSAPGVAQPPISGASAAPATGVSVAAVSFTDPGITPGEPQGKTLGGSETARKAARSRLIAVVAAALLAVALIGGLVLFLSQKPAQDSASTDTNALGAAQSEAPKATPPAPTQTTAGTPAPPAEPSATPSAEPSATPSAEPSGSTEAAAATASAKSLKTPKPGPSGSAKPTPTRDTIGF
jgi:serine/threonine protein kinase